MRIDDAARKAVRKAVRTEASLIRIPLDTLDRRVVSPLFGARSPVHVLLAQGVKTLDVLAGRVPEQYAHPQPVADFWEPEAPSSAEPAAEATAPDTEASAPHAEASADIPSDAEATADTLSDEQEARIEDLTEQILVDEETENFAGELAEDDEIRRVQAEIRAKQTIEDQSASE